MQKSSNLPVRASIEFGALALALACGACAAAEPADAYPSKPLRFITGFTAGGNIANYDAGIKAD